MASVRFGELDERDLAAAQALSAHVGWNQTEADWRRLLDLASGQTVAARAGGELVATATLASYGARLHWIGMVIVHRSQRGKGLGREVLRRALEMGRAYPGSAVGLDATDLGEPLYRKSGFEGVCGIERWAGSLRPLDRGGRPPQAPGGEAPEERASGVITLDGAAKEGELTELIAFDRAASGVEREPLLRHLLGEEGVLGWLTVEGPRTTGYAILRPGRRHWQLGPLVADGRQEMTALLDAAAAHLGGRPVLVDALRRGARAGRADGTAQTDVSGDDIGEVLARSGLEVQRRLLRMSFEGREPTLTGARIGLATGLEWG